MYVVFISAFLYRRVVWKLGGKGWKLEAFVHLVAWTFGVTFAVVGFVGVEGIHYAPAGRGTSGN
jgi:hypothetical protein